MTKPVYIGYFRQQAAALSFSVAANDDVKVTYQKFGEALAAIPALTALDD